MTLPTQETVLKLRSGNQLVNVTSWVDAGTRFFKFPFNNYLKDEIKAMEGARWSPDSKCWYVKNCQRNDFQLRFLMNEPVYQRYDAPIDINLIPPTRFNVRQSKEMSLFAHQRVGAAFFYQRQYCILGEEMGLGKTLQAMIAIELALKSYETTGDIWYVAPRSALYSVQRDVETWGAKFVPKWFTYESFTKELKNWAAGRKSPQIVVFDEFSRCKNYNSQRSQAAMAIADGIRNDWGDRGYACGMTGTPSPKSPADWWSLAEIICPGFLREGNIHKFKNRLAIITMKEGIDGGSYPQLLAWRDDPKKCNICGQLENHESHMLELLSMGYKVHSFVPSKNEVELLGKRLKGLVLVYFKKQCLDLPDKHYRIIECKPTASTLRAASILVKSARSTIEGLTRLRELSDGFQYVETKVGTEQCNLCKGSLKLIQPFEIPDTCPNCKLLDEEQRVRVSKFDIGQQCGRHTPQIEHIEQDCPNCGGLGIVSRFERTTTEVPCPKDEALDELLEEYEDVGRVVIYGGFTGTIDRVVKRCWHRGWFVIRMDQGRVQITDPKGEVINEPDFQSMFQDKLVDFEKVAFVAHPKSGGMGLTLTASPMILYYSNDFDAESRMQSEDRIHRPGLDVSRGATIIDLIHLPSDSRVLENLKKKRDLQSMTLGEFQQALNSAGERPE